ncbi:MAG: signal recognition particle protein Srp19 [Candidatus Hydrothermarchaeaceae archaeon]
MKAVIWPPNIDAQKSRAAGRKIPLKHAVPSPTLSEIKDAAAALGLNPEIEKGKAYPREWWKKGGVAIVDKERPKTLILKEIAGKIRKNRE